MHCAQTAEYIDTISFVFNNRMSLPDRVKIWLTSVNPSCANFVSNLPTPVDLSVGDIRWQTAAECSGIAQWSQYIYYVIVHKVHTKTEKVHKKKKTLNY